jgi:hypothetical protein
LRDGDRLPDVAQVLRPEDFYRDSHQILYRAILGLHDQGKGIDALILAEELKRRGEFEKVGGDRALFELLDSVPHAANTLYHAQIVREKAVGRRIIELCESTLADAYSLNRTAEELVSLASHRFEALRQYLGTSDAGFATLADAARAAGELRWRWDRWIPAGVLSLLVAKGGTGKSRLAMWLARLFWYGLPMPDGSANPLPAGTPTLWVLVDRNWQGTAALASAFGVPLEAVHLNTPKDAPLSLPELDRPQTTAGLKSQILALNPALVVVDTITYATARDTAKADQAKHAFDALMDVAAETGTAILGLTHTNAEGSTLNRRIEERARSAIYLLEPDPETQPGRMRLWVEKAEVEKPSPLGVTHRADRLDFDHAPPAKGEPIRQRGRSPMKSSQLASWLWAQLQLEPVAISTLVDTARLDGLLASPTDEKPKPSISPLYNARDRIPSLYPGYEVEELELAGDGGRLRRYWKIVQASACDAETPPF